MSTEDIRPAEIISEDEAAKALGVSRQTLWRRRKEGSISSLQLGGKIMYERSMISDYLDRCRRIATTA